jgi:acetylornithine deacetylase
MKGSLAACLAAVKALADADRPLRGDLLLAAVADEEYASLGTSDLLQHYSVDGAVVTEPTELEICRAHKGFIWLEVETIGRAYHGSQFSQGVDAIMRMGRFLAALEDLEKELRSRTPHPLVGPPSLHASMIEGGTSWSVYSASCGLKIERRTVPGETQPQVEAEIEALLEPLRQADPAFKASLRTVLVREPFEVSPQAAIVRSVESACRSVLGSVPPHCGQNPWMDSALLASAGIETVVLGPSGSGAHSDQEWVDLNSVEKLAEILTTAAVDYSG